MRKFYQTIRTTVTSVISNLYRILFIFLLISFTGDRGSNLAMVKAASVRRDDSQASQNQFNLKHWNNLTVSPTADVRQSDSHEMVDILIELQKRAEISTGLQHTLQEEQKVDEFLEGDIRLTASQAASILEETQKRKKRKLTEAIVTRWPLPIPYMFDGTHNNEEVRRIKQALAYWQELTCITFVENNRADYKLLFVKQFGCWSYVGFTRNKNQTISIGDGCQSNGTIAHEIGHAVGFWHEQSRPDRDDHVLIHSENVTEGKLYNFLKRTWGEIIDLNVPYDLGSVMHYGSKYYAKDPNGTLITVQTNDPLMIRVIGQRQELSFSDVKLANKAYCDGLCSSYGIRLPQPCRREGYQDPKNCWRCRCPEGFGGLYCESVHQGALAYCGGVLDARYKGVIASPGYLSPGYRVGVQCNWLLKAPEHSHVYLEFIGPFGTTCHTDVCKDFVEVRYNTSLALTGARFCCTDIPKHPIRSDGNEMLVLFRSYPESQQCDDVKFPWKCKTSQIGFKAKFYTKTCGGCDGRGIAQPACKRRVSYACMQIWEQKVKIDCPAWWQTPSCGERIERKQRTTKCTRDSFYCCEGYQLSGSLCIPVMDRDGNKVQPKPDEGSIPDKAMGRVKPPKEPYDTEGVSDKIFWSSWTEWSNCSSACGGGESVRTRYCLKNSRPLCGKNTIQYDRKPCGEKACYETCAERREVLCDLWKKCAVTEYRPCKPYCKTGFNLNDDENCVVIQTSNI